MKIGKKFNEVAVKTAVAVSKQANVMPGDGEAAARLVEQYNIVMKLETSCFRERVKFGLALIEWEQFLGKSLGGRGRDGEGLKGWLETHCPEIAYATAMEYKTYARQAIELNGGGKRVVAALLGEATVMQPDGEVVEVEAETIEKCEKFFADVDSRRKLQQAYFDFMNGDGAQQGGKKRTKGLVMEEPKAKLSAGQFAHAKWSDIIEPAVKKCAKLVRLAASLTVEDAQDAIDALRPLMDALRERVKEG